MPREKYKEVFDKNTKNNLVDMTNVADYFGVSIVAARNRGKFLGYLKW